MVLSSNSHGMVTQHKCCSNRAVAPVLDGVVEQFSRHGNTKNERWLGHLYIHKACEVTPCTIKVMRILTFIKFIIFTRFTKFTPGQSKQHQGHRLWPRLNLVKVVIWGSQHLQKIFNSLSLLRAKTCDPEVAGPGPE